MLENISKLKHVEDGIECQFLMSTGASFAQVKSALCHFMKLVCILEDQAFAERDKKEKPIPEEPKSKKKT